MYYYRSRRVGNRVVKEYVGTGEVAALAAKLDAIAGVKRAEVIAERRDALDEIAELDRIMAPVHELVDAVVAIVLTQEGYHMSRNNWRKKRNKRFREQEPAAVPPAAPPVAAPPTESVEPVAPRELLDRAKAGDAAAAGRVCEEVDRPGAVQQYNGDVAAAAVALMVERMVGDDTTARDRTLGKMAQIRDELAGPGASILVQLVADRVVSTWLHLHRLEGEYARLNESDTRRTAAQQAAISTVQKRYFAAIEELVRLRNRPVRATVVNAVGGPGCV